MKWLILILLCSTSIASANHELEDRNLSAGQILYTNNCASCHGAKLEGQPNWQSPNSDGILPAPPHDATGHTWHHDNELLFEYTKLGGKGALAARGITISIVECLLLMASSLMKISGTFLLLSSQLGLSGNRMPKLVETHRTSGTIAVV